MNKNGFIATSLIYSFFLIFITLFLTIIADYLQDKVLLNTIEKGIKDELNSTMSIEDFEVGDMISFDNDPDDDYDYSPWIIANVNYQTKKIIIYSYELTENKNIDIEFPSCSRNFVNYFPNNLTKDNINSDIEIGYRNSTYLNKILYTYAKMGEISTYNILNDEIISKNCSLCKKIDGTTCNEKEENCICTKNEFDIIPNKCITDGTSTHYRKRIELDVGNIKFEKIQVIGDESNSTILLKCE